MPALLAQLGSLLLESVHDAVMVTDGHGIVSLWNAGATRLYGWSAEECVGRHLFERYPPERRDRVAPLLAALSSHTEWRGELEDVRRDGTRVWVDVRAFALSDDGGRIVGMVVIASDITTRRRSEEALLGHNRILELIARGTPVEKTLTEVVQMVEDQLPGSLCSVLLLDEANCLHVGAAPSLPAAYNAAIEGARIGPRRGSCGAAAFHGRTVVTTDIESDQIWTEFCDVALASELRSCLSVPIFASGHVPGIEGGRVLGTFAVYRREIGPPDPHAFAIVSGALSDVDDGVHQSTHALAVAGAAHLARVAIERDLAQQAIRDSVTHRKFAQQERDYIWNNSPDPVCIAGFDGYLHQLNPAWTRRLGWSVEELQAHPWLTFVHPDDLEATKAAGERLRQGETLYGFTNRYRAKDGAYRWFSWNAIPFQEQQSIYGFIRDITEEQQLAEQVRQAQKMEAIGQLAGGVAHDFNNLLTVINGYTAMLLNEESAQSARRESLAEVRDAGERAAALTAQLLAFSRKAIVEPKVLDLNEATASTIRLLKRLVGEDVRFEANFSPGLPNIRIDPGQLEQVLMNLVVNARDAMPTGGLLQVSTRETVLPVGLRGEASSTPSGRYVKLVVSDTGVGMSDAVKAHLFEPFFTTKGVGKGTGLGLATVYGIVRQAGGTILVDSEVGKGTTFHVLFPAREAASEIHRSVSAHAAPKGHETLLIVEDEPAVRRFTRVSLERQGYRVHEAASGRDALAMDDDDLAEVSLLITDVIMPLVGGRQLADQLRQRCPDLRVLYMSGYTDDAVVRHGLESAADAFLQKPFTPRGLARKVRDVLDAHVPPASA